MQVLTSSLRGKQLQLLFLSSSFASTCLLLVDSVQHVQASPSSRSQTPRHRPESRIDDKGGSDGTFHLAVIRIQANGVPSEQSNERCQERSERLQGSSPRQLLGPVWHGHLHGCLWPLWKSRWVSTDRKHRSFAHPHPHEAQKPRKLQW